MEVQFLTKSCNTNNIHWYCNSCEILSTPLITRLRSAETQIDNINGRIDKLESLTQRIEALEKDHTRQPLLPTPETREPLQNGTEEIVDRLNRRNNAVIFGLAEKDEEQTKQHIEVIAEKLEVNMKMLKITRAGRPRTDGKPRPIIIELATEQEKWNFIKKANSIRYREIEELKNIYIKPDLTKTQRQEDSKLREELKTRRAKGEDNLIIRKGKIVAKN